MICREGEGEDEPLSQICKVCKKDIHTKCFDNWVVISKGYACPYCKTQCKEYKRENTTRVKRRIQRRKRLERSKCIKCKKKVDKNSNITCPCCRIRFHTECNNKRDHNHRCPNCFSAFSPRRRDTKFLTPLIMGAVVLTSSYIFSILRWVPEVEDAIDDFIDVMGVMWITTNFITGFVPS